MDSTDRQDLPVLSQPAIIARLATGLVQGLALYLLYSAADAKNWPATEPTLFAPLLLIFAFVPVIVLGGTNNMRLRTLAIWAAAASLVLAGLAAHDIIRDPTPERILPRFVVIFVTAVGLFIAHALITASDADKKLIASYPRYFDGAWKQGVQLALAVVFVGVFWGLLFLGAALFQLIKLDFLKDLIEHRWFWIPVTALAFACAIHVTDIRVSLVRGTRTLILTLLSWLLPMMALLGAGFLLALPFTGLEPLWRTRSATSILLVAAAALIVLTNAAYQGGEADTRAPRVFRIAGTLTAIILVPLVGLASYALYLRIAQYGFTQDRIVALCCVLVAVSHALGYAAAAVRPGPWLKWLERTNVVSAFIVLALLLAVFSPIADPARIAVADQVHRLKSGKVAPERFDYLSLRFDGARYGKAALEELKQTKEGPKAALIAERATKALDAEHNWETPEILPPDNLAGSITVHPAGTVLPESFLKQDWSHMPENRWRVPDCLWKATARCDAVLADLDRDGKAEILLFAAPSGQAAGFKATPNGKWSFLGTLSNLHCGDVRDKILKGEFAVAPPLLDEIAVGEERLRIEWQGCKESAPSLLE